MNTQNEYPLYPTLMEGGAEEAQSLIDGFKKQLAKAAEEVLGNIYCDLIPNIESDAWTNMRNQLIEGLCNYNNRKIQGQYDFKKIRQTIYQEYRDDIIQDLNQDMLGEIKSLKKEVEYYRNLPRY